MAEAHDQMTERVISDYLTGAVLDGLIKGINTRKNFGLGHDFYLVQPIVGDVIEYDRAGIVKYVGMLKAAGVEPRTIF